MEINTLREGIAEPKQPQKLQHEVYEKCKLFMQEWQTAASQKRTAELIDDKVGGRLKKMNGVQAVELHERLLGWKAKKHKRYVLSKERCE